MARRYALKAEIAQARETPEAPAPREFPIRTVRGQHETIETPFGEALVLVGDKVVTAPDGSVFGLAHADYRARFERV